MKNLIDAYDNFLQYWKENTEEDQHASRVDINHRHLHVKINDNKLKLYEGRNNAIHIASSDVVIEDDSITLFGISGSTKDEAADNYCIHQDGKITIKGFIHFDNPVPYVLKQCRPFAGWIMNLIPGTEDEYNRVDHLTIHDQGGLSELIYSDKIYTAELTQLEFAHTIHVFKLALYDMPMSEVGINSRAFAYTWVNPEASRIGMNMRYVQSGWTMIEKGFVNSDNLNKP